MNTQTNMQVGSLAKPLVLASRQRRIRWLFMIGVLTLCVTVPAYAQVPPSESSALQALYTDTAGDNWTNNTNWKVGGRFNVGHECSWYGITCNVGHVVSIELYNNNLSGPFPDLVGLTKLQLFNVEKNLLTGSIPSLTGLTSLQTLAVGENLLTGPIPSLAGLTNLRGIYVLSNQLTGSLPDLSGLINLSVLQANSNQLSGSIPDLSGLTNLLVFETDVNQLTGSIPDLAKAEVTNIRWFIVGSNQLSGSIPDSLIELTNLQEFDVDNNQLSGSLPDLSGLTNLQQFMVDNNHLSGSLPNLTGLTHLQYFRAYENQLTSSIPSLNGLANLRDFEVDTNQLIGSLPDLSGLTQLQQFNVENNLLTGSIPVLTGLSNLNNFVVGNNLLSGLVPAVPNPDNLIAGQSSLCPNSLTASSDPAWDAATGSTPWFSFSSGICGVTPTAVNLDQHGLTGSWYNPAISGQGFEIEVYPDQGLLFAGWFTYDVTAAGGRRWYGLSGNVNNTDTTATLQIFAEEGGNLNAPPIVNATGALGQATIQFSDCNTGSLTYNFTDGSGRSGTIPLTRLTPNVTCLPRGDEGYAPTDYLQSGNWFSPSTSGQGLFFDISPSIHNVLAGWYTFASNGQQIGGPASQDWYTLQSAEFVDGTTSLESIPIIETSGGVFDSLAPTTSVQVGTANIAFQSCSAMTLSYTFTSGANQGKSGTINLVRVGPTPSGCNL